MKRFLVVFFILILAWINYFYLDSASAACRTCTVATDCLGCTGTCVQGCCTGCPSGSSCNFDPQCASGSCCNYTSTGGVCSPSQCANCSYVWTGSSCPAGQVECLHPVIGCAGKCCGSAFPTPTPIPLGSCPLGEIGCSPGNSCTSEGLPCTCTNSPQIGKCRNTVCCIPGGGPVAQLR